MSIARQLFHEFRPLFRMLDEPLTRSPSFFGHPSRSIFDDPFFKSAFISRPAVDVTEEGNQYVLEADLPGVKKENVDVRIGDGGRSITIEGKLTGRRSRLQTAGGARSQGQAVLEGTDAAARDSTVVAGDSANHISAERSYAGNFTRTVWLPRPVGSDNVTAKLDEGVLTITVNKVEDKATTVIPVQ